MASSSGMESAVMMDAAARAELRKVVVQATEKALAAGDTW